MWQALRMQYFVYEQSDGKPRGYHVRLRSNVSHFPGTVGPLIIRAPCKISGCANRNCRNLAVRETDFRAAAACAKVSLWLPVAARIRRGVGPLRESLPVALAALSACETSPT